MKLKKLLLSSTVIALFFSACTPLNIADTGMFNDLGDIKAHLAKGEDINFKDKDGTTALMNAVAFGYLDNVKYLLEKGADITLVDNEGDNAFMHLFIFDKPKDREILELLISKGVEVNQENEDGETALYESLSNGLPRHVEMLLDKGANIEKNTKDGESTLSAVCLNFNFEKAKKVVDVLVEKRVNLNLKDANGETLSQNSACEVNKKLLAYLKEKGLK